MPVIFWRAFSFLYTGVTCASFQFLVELHQLMILKRVKVMVQVTHLTILLVS